MTKTENAREKMPTGLYLVYYEIEMCNQVYSICIYGPAKYGWHSTFREKYTGA